MERAFSVVKPWWRFETSYNVAPSQQVPVVRRGADGTEGVMLRWGLVPFFAKGVAPKYSTINARVETVETAASYRGPWKRGQRCIQLPPASTSGTWAAMAASSLFSFTSPTARCSVSPRSGTGRLRRTGLRSKAARISP